MPLSIAPRDKMKFIPILFSTAMVNAILSGDKSMTRRVVSKRNSYCGSGLFDELNFKDVVRDGLKSDYQYLKAACDIDETRHRVYYKGEVGDVLWVRETFAEYHGCPIYKADEKWKSIVDGDLVKWKPSLFMPKVHCRIFLEIVAVKAEQVNNISEEDAKNEGVAFNKEWMLMDYMIQMYRCITFKESFKSLWQKINGVESWNENPYVWAICFKRIETPENFLS